MLVIEGKSRKSVKLAEKLKQLTQEVNPREIKVIDYVEIPHLFHGKADYCSKGDEMTVENFVADYEEAHLSFESMKYLFLSLNAPKSMLDDIKALEDKYDKKIVVTIQNDVIENHIVYEY